MSDTGYAPVSVEDEHGRVLTGVGVTKDSLEAAIDATEQPVEGEAAPAIPEPSTQPMSRGQSRFARLRGERDAEKQRADAAEARAKELESRLQAPQHAPTMPPPSPEPPRAVPQLAATQTPASAGAPLTRPKPLEEQVGSVYPSYADFVEDLADWKAEQRLAKLNVVGEVRAQLNQAQTERTFADHLAASVKAATEVAPDFQQKWDAYMAGPVRFAPDDAADQRRAHWLLTQPHRAHILIALANDAKLTPRLAQMDDLAFAREIAALAPAPAVVAPASTAAPVVSPAPAPYQPVGAGSKTTVPPLTDLAKKAGFDYDNSGYRERRAAERGGMRRVR